MGIHMADLLERFLAQHNQLTRRYLLQASAVGLMLTPRWSFGVDANDSDNLLADAIAKLESMLTRQEEFRDVSRGKPLPHSLPVETKQEVGLTRETWKLQVTSDEEEPTKVRAPLTVEKGTAFDFEQLMSLTQKHAVRFTKVMTCLNIGCPLGNGVWEGVPLRELIWLAKPQRDLRRVYYYGYHNNKPDQMFRSSLPIGRILEDPFDLPPVILCYKLNGQWLTSERGGPVRIVVPEAYGFKSIKWVTNVVLTNLFHANDTYANGNNDVDSPLKTFAATLSIPKEVAANEPIPVTGYAQVGISGLSRVQVWIQRKGEERPPGEKHFSEAPWKDAEILDPPSHWGGDFENGQIPPNTWGFENDGSKPKVWPLRLSKVHWAALLPGLPAGEYTFRCRTVDEKGIGQPMPRPFRKSGHCAIEQIGIKVKT